MITRAALNLVTTQSFTKNQNTSRLTTTSPVRRSKTTQSRLNLFHPRNNQRTFSQNHLGESSWKSADINFTFAANSSHPHQMSRIIDPHRTIHRRSICFDLLLLTLVKITTTYVRKPLIICKPCCSTRVTLTTCSLTL